jgi:hypothetical protein
VDATFDLTVGYDANLGAIVGTETHPGETQ